MEKKIPKNRLVSLPELAELIISVFNCTYVEAADIVVDALDPARSQNRAPVIYEAASSFLAVSLSPNLSDIKISDSLSEFFNTHWWDEQPEERGRPWDYWGVDKECRAEVLQFVADQWQQPLTSRRIKIEVGRLDRSKPLAETRKSSEAVERVSYRSAKMEITALREKIETLGKQIEALPTKADGDIDESQRAILGEECLSSFAQLIRFAIDNDLNQSELLEFFVGRRAPTADYLDPQHQRYSPKLAASINAWLAVTDENGKHPKGALTDWLEENAAQFGLVKEDGTLNNVGIDECAKVANWKPGGGAPKTPNK
jgi:hypothetical protein